MKILLSMVKTVPMDEMAPPLSLLVLASVAQRDGHEVKIVFPIDLEAFLAGLPGSLEGCDLCGFSVNSFNWFATREIIWRIHGHNPRIPIVLGGAHASYYDRYCLETSPAHAVVRGEGEVTFSELLKATESGCMPETIAGVTYKTDVGEVIANPDRPLLTENGLEKMPLPAYYMIPPGRYGFIPLETSRGCKYRCIYCATPFPGTYRKVSLERVRLLLQHLDGLTDRFERKGIFLSDDSFSAHKTHAEGVLRLFSKTNPDFMIGCEARINEITRHNLLPAFSRVNVFLVQVGVECGYDEGLKRIRKGLRMKQVVDFARQVAQTPFRSQVYWSFIIGFPWETEKEVLKTINFSFNIAASSGSQQPQVNSFSPYPGSEILRHGERYGLDSIGPRHYDSNRWFHQFIGYTRIPLANREFIHRYLQQRHNAHPHYAILPFLQFPDGSVVDNRELQWPAAGELGG